jgi:hypothetical protein
LLLVANTATSLCPAEDRHREMAVRIALGARPADLMRLFLSRRRCSPAGAAVGLLLAHVSLKAITVFTPVRLPRLSEVDLDSSVVAFTCSVAALGALLFSGLAFLRQSAPASTAALMLNASTRMTDDGGRRRTRNVLVAVRSLALTLLVASALMVQSVWRLTHVDRASRLRVCSIETACRAAGPAGTSGSMNAGSRAWLPTVGPHPPRVLPLDRTPTPVLIGALLGRRNGRSR